MLNMNKTISINPELFTLTNTKKKSRKKDISNTNNKIKVKPGQSEKQKRKHIRKQHILKFLRQQQEKNYQKLLQSENSQVKKNTSKQDETFDNDFGNSLKYLKSLSENNHQGHNYTVKTNFNKVNRLTSLIGIFLNSCVLFIILLRIVLFDTKTDILENTFDLPNL